MLLQSPYGISEQDAAYHDLRTTNARDALDGAMAHECGTHNTARPWVRLAYEPVRAEDIPAAFMRAIATAFQPPSGPVFLSLPLDDWENLAQARPW